METYPEKAKPVLKAKSIILSLHFTNGNLADPNGEEQLELYEKILNHRSKYISQRKKFTSSSNLFRENDLALRVAAIIVMAFLASILLNKPVIELDAAELLPEISLIMKAAPYGQKLTTILPDGSIVKLNSGSTIYYPEFFDNKREVTLEGEAFFEVERNPDLPFFVKTASIRTAVLGTSFNIKCYGDNTDIEVAVLSGRVSVHHISVNNVILDSIVLDPLQMATFKEANQKFIEKEFNYNQILGWKDNLICFSNSGIDEILTTLERWYGVQFKVNKAIPKERDFSGDYYNKSLDAILEGLSYTFDFNFRVNGKTVLIY
jgi:transmembrane sensor